MLDGWVGGPLITLGPTQPGCPPLLPPQNGWGPDIYLRYSTQSKLYITPPDTAVGVEPSDGAILVYAPPSPPSPPPFPSPS